MKKAVKKFLIGTGVAAAGVAAVGAASHAITEYMMKVALDREMPKVRNQEKAREQLSGLENMDAFYSSLVEAGKALEQSGCETVSMNSYDGETLVGHWHQCEGAKRVIIAMHGWRSSWTRDFGIISQFWHDSGCSVLYAEQRGQNNSGGEHMGFGMMESRDCLEWVKWVNQRCGGQLPVYLAGVSMGATTVLLASELDLPDSVHGIIADCGFTSPNAIWKHVTEHNLHLSYGIRSAAANGICKRKTQLNAREYSTVEALKKNKIPVLLIHGTDDHFVPVEMTYENYKACAGPKQLFVVPGADHGMSYITDTQGYQAVMEEFWESWDGSR